MVPRFLTQEFLSEMSNYNHNIGEVKKTARAIEGRGQRSSKIPHPVRGDDA